MNEQKLRNFNLSIRKLSVLTMKLDQGIYRELKSISNQLNLISSEWTISIQAKGLESITSSVERLKKTLLSPMALTFHINDQLSEKITTIKKSILQLMNRTYYLRLNMIDQATAAIQRIKKTLRSLTMAKHEIRVSVQDNAKSKLKKRDKAESVVKEQGIKKEPEAVTTSAKTDDNKQNGLQKFANQTIKEVQQYAGDVADKVKETFSPKNFWDTEALPWVEKKLGDYQQEVFSRIREKIKFNPEKKLDELFNSGLDRIFGSKNQSNEQVDQNTSTPSNPPRAEETRTSPAPRPQQPSRSGKGLFRTSCCPCCARGMSRRGATRTRDRNGRSQRQPTNPTSTTRAERNRRSPLTSIGQGSSKLLKKVPLIGGLLSATNLIGMKKENAGEKIGATGGGIAGGMAGAATGAAIGSVVPVIGTAAGGLIGGILGSMGGESIGETIGKWFDGGGFEKIGQKAIEIKDQIVEVWSTVADWFNENVWAPLSGTVVTVATTIWTSLVNAWTWIQETFSAVAGWFIENVWTPVSSAVITVAKGIWTALSGAWKIIQSIFGAVSTWFMDHVWNPLIETVGTIKEGIGEKFKAAYKVVTDIWDGLSKWFKDHIQTPIVKVAGAISDGFSKAFGWVKKIFDKAGGVVDLVVNWVTGKPDKNATGGYITQPTLSWVGEAGNEFVIPTQNNRGRGKMLLAKAASHLGMSVVPSGGSASPVASSPATTPRSSVGPVGGSLSMSGNMQAAGIGAQFNTDFEQGLHHHVISIDQWKQKNIQQPFGQLTRDTGKYGQQTASAFATGQQMTPTGTDRFLQNDVKAPYQQVLTASSTWGSSTVTGFATGQNATSIGTSQYVNQHVKQPFLQGKQESPGWGSGMIDAFNSGMRSKSGEVTQAAKEMAKKVEQAFREELDIHSPSRVMMSLGKFASIGVVKGLDSVDVKKFAENQAGSLIGAFSGMGASGLSVHQWLMAALMATGTSMNWLPGLMTIAQHESNGNPRAINLWDSNAKKGTPSKGLMQTIGPTFNSNKGKGMNDIWNPIHNAVAAINYIKGRYGTVFNTPGLRSMRKGGPYKGYANGGLITQEQVARVGEGNKREWIIPEERGIRGRYLLTQAAKALGMQVYDPASASSPLPESQMQQVTSTQTTGSTTSSGNKQITIQFNGDQHFHNGQDQQSFVEKIRQMLIDELEVELHTGTKGVVIDG
ncbi:hypothetical protein BACPU_28100 [Bacillus pumilus]|nr:hypothetical protein BACPU_28100 [Bacillus pumilus]